MFAWISLNVILFLKLLGCCVLGAENVGDTGNQPSARDTAFAIENAGNASRVLPMVSGGRYRGLTGNIGNVTRVLEKLLRQYDVNARPGSETGFPTLVAVDMFVVAIVPISEVNMEFTTTFYIRNFWRDPRLAYGDLLKDPRITLVGDVTNRIWTPDLFYENDMSDHVTRHNYLLWLFRNGSVIYSVRKRVKAYCPMEFHDFPMDEQKCELAFESFSYSKRDLVISWKDNVPVQVSDRLKLANYRLVSWQNKARMHRYHSTGHFTSLFVEFVFKRNIGFYVIQTYIPAALIVAISWVSFWIDERSVPARVSLGITTVLAITTLLFGVQSSMPKVGHVKAIDMYLLGNFLFVFGALVEYAIICYLEVRSQSGKKKKRLRKSSSATDVYSNGSVLMDKYTSIRSPGMGRGPEVNNNEQIEEENGTTTRKRDIGLATSPSFTDRNQRARAPNQNITILGDTSTAPSSIENRCCSIDQVSRVLFPALYIVFIVVYLVFYKVVKFT